MSTRSAASLQMATRGSLRTWVARHPVASYVLFTLAWSWSIWSLLFLVIEPGGLLHNPPPISFLFVVIGGFGPSLSGLLCTWLIYGREGMQALGARLRNWQVGRWWLALLIIPGITALTPLLRWLSGYEVDTSAMLALIGPGLGLGLTAGLMEEIGWRGFLLPHLLKRYSPLVATLLLGIVIWGGLWHGYADYFGLGDKGPAFWPLMLLLGPALLTAWSLIITRVYQRTQGSLLLSILMHASLSSSALIFGQAYAAIGEEMTWTAISVGVAWLGSALIWLAVRPAKD
ncbi:MAG TPA: CPBP family intramembrane glutamic endopeptidase [Anaerolineales bacterium]|nr:CPBP family intramembrane glutamic endopeptidase [Anaerolineales bacterium]